MKIMRGRPLYFQLLFTVLAFIAMASLSFLFMRDIVHSNLVRNAESVFSFAKTQLESDLVEPRMMLSSFSQTIRSMILRRNSINSIIEYINDTSDYVHSRSSRIMNSVDLFAYLESFDEPVFLSNRPMPADFNVYTRPWFIEAQANCIYSRNCNNVIETSPFESAVTYDQLIIYAKCIHDDSGIFMGIIGLNVHINEIGRNVVNIALGQGGYGMVISRDLTVIAHANEEFTGRNINDMNTPLYELLDDFMAGRDILERPFVNWKGEKTIAFFRKLDNGWYLGLLTPEGPFYQSLTSMAVTLIILGIIFASILVIILIRIDAAKNKSDRESRHKSAFLANMSHEIRTPMNAIIGMTAIGKSSGDIGKKDHCFEKIEDASNHLLGVINDILDMSKIEANKFDFSHSEFNFEKMLQRLVNVVNFRVEEKFQKFTVYIDQKIPKTLIGDDQRIAQVITNLLGNAIKFTPNHGFISLNTCLLNETDNICSIQISIADNGIGMTDEQQKRIFSSFEQAESSTTRKYGGTGLGLSISKSIIEMMGGRLWVESEPDRGSTFTFVLDLKRGNQTYQGLLAPDVNLGNVRVMVVDDDQDILEYFTEISREFKIQCDTAISGEDAIKIVEQQGRYHIYFVDWKMPGMDGIQLTAELKALHESVKSIVIMITAAEWTEVEKEAREAGVDKFLSKPLFPSHIADVLNEALGVNQKQLEDSQIDINGLFAGRRILLVEDVEINREIVKALLEPTHIEIECAENGKEALQKFTDEPYKYDVIFMDVQMPVMDGYEATRRIRALNVPQAQIIRIVAMTANVFREDIEMCLEAGMDNHIGKPLNLDEIIEKLMIYLPKKKQN